MSRRDTDPIDDPPDPGGDDGQGGPISQDPLGGLGADPGPQTVAQPGRALPILYGTRKVPALLLEKAAPTTGVPARRAALTAYQAGEYVTVNAYVVSGATSQDAVFRCTTGGTTSASTDFSSAGSVITIGSTYADGTCVWTLDAIGAVKMTYQTALMAICEGQAQGSLQLYWDKEKVTAISLTSPGKALTIQLGKDDLSQNVPASFDTAIDYQHTAVLYGTAFWTGVEKEIPPLALLMQGVMFGVATNDVNPADVVNDLLTHSRRGVEWPGSRVDTSITGTAAGGYRVYCDAFGLRVSMLLDSQKPALDWLADILRATNSDAYWSQGKIKIVALGDVASVGHVYGATDYVPTNTSQFALGLDDFLGPVEMSRRPDADCYNSWPIEFVDSAVGYARSTIEDADMADVDVRGLCRAPTTVLPFTVASASNAVMLSRILAQRSLNIRNTYRFRLSWKYLSLDPSDIVTLTEPELGLSATPVRILSITEGDDHTLDFVAEDYPSKVQGATTYTPQAGDGYVSNDRLTTAALPVAVDGSTMGMGVAVVTAGTILAAACGNAALSNKNTLNLWPNPTSENAPPVGADVSIPVWSLKNVLTSGSAEWYGRTFVAAAWAATHAYVVGNAVTNGGLGYVCSAAGTSAGSGGPTGTGTNIVDGAGTLRWNYESSTVLTNSAGASAGYYVRANTGNAQQIIHLTPATQGESYYASVRALTHSGGGFAALILIAVDANQNIVASTTVNNGGSGAWTQLSASLTSLPANTVGVYVSLLADVSTTCLWDTIQFRQMTDTQALVPSGTQYQVLTTVSGAAAWADGSKKTLTTTGDTLYAGAANTLARLAAGTTDQELVIASGLPSWYSGAKKLLDATGAMLYASAANVLAKLGIGTNGDILQVVSGIPAWKTTLDQPAWTAPTLLNSWVQHSTLQTVDYFKDSLGVVHLRGGIKNGTINTAAFTLPSGYRPSGLIVFAVPSNDVFGLLQVTTAGDVKPAVGSNAYFSLDGVTFDTR